MAAKKGHEWTAYDERYLKMNFGILKLREIANSLHRSYETVHTKATLYGLFEEKEPKKQIQRKDVKLGLSVKYGGKKGTITDKSIAVFVVQFRRNGRNTYKEAFEYMDFPNLTVEG